MPLFKKSIRLDYYCGLQATRNGNFILAARQNRPMEILEIYPDLQTRSVLSCPGTYVTYLCGPKQSFPGVAPNFITCETAHGEGVSHCYYHEYSTDSVDRISLTGIRGISQYVVTPDGHSIIAHNNEGTGMLFCLDRTANGSLIWRVPLNGRPITMSLDAEGNVYMLYKDKVVKRSRSSGEIVWSIDLDLSTALCLSLDMTETDVLVSYIIDSAGVKLCAQMIAQDSGNCDIDMVPPYSMRDTARMYIPPYFVSGRYDQGKLWRLISEDRQTVAMRLSLADGRWERVGHSSIHQPMQYIVCPDGRIVVVGTLDEPHVELIQGNKTTRIYRLKRGEDVKCALSNQSVLGVYTSKRFFTLTI